MKELKGQQIKKEEFESYLYIEKCIEKEIEKLEIYISLKEVDLDDSKKEKINLIKKTIDHYENEHIEQVRCACISYEIEPENFIDEYENFLIKKTR